MKTRPFRRKLQYRASCPCEFQGEWTTDRTAAVLEQDQHDRGCQFIEAARAGAAASAYPFDKFERGE